MFRFGDGAQAGANNCKPSKQNLRLNQQVLAVLLLVCFSSGQGSMSTARLQQHFSHAQQDGLTHLTVPRLAGVGTAQNARNGLMSSLVTCDIPPLITRVISDQMTHMELVLPSTWIWLQRACLVQFSWRLGANIQNTRAFWSHFFAREPTKAWADRHFFFVAQNRGRSRPRCSANRTHWPNSCVVTSFSSLLGQGHGKLPKNLCGSCVKRSGGQVAVGAWDRLITDLLPVTTGVVGGSPVAVGVDGALWRFLLLFTTCGEEARCNEFGMTHYNGADEVCSEYLANRTHRPLTDMHADAAWRLTEELP